ncbi:MAG TPA: hypothetical protein VI461_07180 [Chitinophagaceae bacterium]|nr:hypothetical protein [Chitinophagaceae bacterium]
MGSFKMHDITWQPRPALTWSFGKLTENVSKKKGVNNDDLLTKLALFAAFFYSTILNVF